MTAMRARPLYDIVALLARIGIGAVFIAHGWQKVQVGITTTSDQFTGWDVPFPTAAAVYATFVELLGGTALVLGLALPVAGVLLFIDMAGAAVFVHGTNGIFLVDEHGVAKNGFELALVLGVAGLVFAAGGAGRITLDSRLFGRRTAAAPGPTPAPPAAPPAGHASDPDALDAATGGRDERAIASSPASTSTSTSTPTSTSTSTSRSSAASAESTTPRSGTPAKSATQKKPAMPATTGGPTVAESAASPRLAADIVTDTSRDTLVAGRKKRRPGGKKDSSDVTQPIPRPGAPKKDSGA
jgi:putative oxidoreductase